VEAYLGNGVNVLSEDECWQRLTTADVGRLAVAAAGEPEIFPINFVVDGTTVVFRTAEGTKLAALTISSRVALEIDGYEDNDGGEAWSVVLKGTAERLDHFADIYAAEQLALFPWQAGPKQWFVRIGQATVSGRSFPVARGQRED
jgi:nitroimidazol reductase NimA-like FMN-containing flavoprotein (pyridoxamine 5'-phosphate oxidase superfamily)